MGGLYYADLINNYGGNRVLALAAYNAGPNRVRRWREGGLSVGRWVDTIPFKETREYVRAVLAYNVIYSLKAGVAVEFLSESERAKILKTITKIRGDNNEKSSDAILRSQRRHD